jgi:cell division FtsZ-interacting protein ZapD
MSLQNITKWTPDQENYLEWLTLPVQLRTPKTKTEYAEQIKTSRQTLYNWENLQGFDDDRRNRIKQKQRESTPDIIDTLKNKALSGDIQAIRIWLEWTEGLENKISLESREPINIKFVRENGNNKNCDVDKPV